MQYPLVVKKWGHLSDAQGVDGGLFSGSVDVPRSSKIARSYLLHVGSLDWTKINPDIFGCMIQSVADDEERGALGMHYASVPNILRSSTYGVIPYSCASFVIGILQTRSYTSCLAIVMGVMSEFENAAPS